MLGVIIELVKVRIGWGSSSRSDDSIFRRRFQDDPYLFPKGDSKAPFSQVQRRPDGMILIAGKTIGVDYTVTEPESGERVEVIQTEFVEPGSNKLRATFRDGNIVSLRLDSRTVPTSEIGRYTDEVTEFLRIVSNYATLHLSL